MKTRITSIIRTVTGDLLTKTATATTPTTKMHMRTFALRRRALT